MKKGSSFSWGCPACGQGSVIVAEDVLMTFDEALGIIAHKHFKASPGCISGWEKILTVNLGGCPYFGPEPVDGVTEPPTAHAQRPIPQRFIKT